jgi:hypothetical protein
MAQENQKRALASTVMSTQQMFGVAGCKTVNLRGLCGRGCMLALHF